MWAKGYIKHTTQKVVDLYENYIFPILRHPRIVYTDNGNHFVNELVKNYYQNCGIIYYTRLISYPLSMRLLERVIQELVAFLKTKYSECKTTDT